MIGAIWNDKKDAVVAVLADGAFFATCIGVLWAVHPLIAMLPVGEDQKEALEQLHFQAVYATLLVLAAETVLRILKHALEKLTNGH